MLCHGGVWCHYQIVCVASYSQGHFQVSTLMRSSVLQLCLHCTTITPHRICTTWTTATPNNGHARGFTSLRAREERDGALWCSSPTFCFTCFSFKFEGQNQNSHHRSLSFFVSGQAQHGFSFSSFFSSGMTDL